MTRKSGSFWRTMLSIAVPVTLQNLLFSSFTLIDTLMIGRLGDTPLAAVGMAGKWTWFFDIALFGFTSGAAVFIAQLYGANDERGIHRTHGLMTLFVLAASLFFLCAGVLAPERVVSLFTRDPEAIRIASSYLLIVALCYPFQALSKAGGTLLQSTQRVVIPFAGAACSMITNIVLNAVLIFGLLGFPALGVQGAAIASAIAAVVNCTVIYATALARGTLMRAHIRELLDFDLRFVRDYLKIGTPAMLNETIWALGNLIYSAIYGHMGTSAYAAITVVKSIEDLTSVAILGICSSSAVMIGSFIGRGETQRARDCARRHLLLSTAFSVIIGCGVLALRTSIISLCGVSEAVRADALRVMCVYAMEMPLRTLPLMFVVGTFRAGGDTRFGLIVDTFTAYLIGIPLTALTGLFLHASVPMTYLVMYLLEDVPKVFIYGRHFLSGRWIRPVTAGRP